MSMRERLRTEQSTRRDWVKGTGAPAMGCRQAVSEATRNGVRRVRNDASRRRDVAIGVDAESSNVFEPQLDIRHHAFSFRNDR